MKIGILEAEQLTADTIQKFGSYADMTQGLLMSVDNSLSFQTWLVVDGEYPQDIHECDAYLITGSKASAYGDEAWIRQLETYIRLLSEQRKKLIGICFGHQLIAQALGGRVEKSDKGWGTGIMSSKLLLTKPWMAPEQNVFSLLVSHQDQVIKLPPNADCIAGNDFCVNSSYLIENHILTFQGHPEFSVEYARQSMDGRREIIGEQKYQQAKASLQQAIDHKVIAEWILNFIRES